MDVRPLRRLAEHDAEVPHKLTSRVPSGTRLEFKDLGKTARHWRLDLSLVYPGRSTIIKGLGGQPQGTQRVPGAVHAASNRMIPGLSGPGYD
jgi:hypothetical protein